MKTLELSNNKKSYCEAQAARLLMVYVPTLGTVVSVTFVQAPPGLFQTKVKGPFEQVASIVKISLPSEIPLQETGCDERVAPQLEIMFPPPIIFEEDPKLTLLLTL